MMGRQDESLPVFDLLEERRQVAAKFPHADAAGR